MENIARIAGGQIDLGFAIGTSARAAFEGTGDNPAVSELRVVAPLYPNVAHILVRDDAGIESVADLAGKVGIGGICGKRYGTVRPAISWGPSTSTTKPSRNAICRSRNRRQR